VVNEGLGESRLVHAVLDEAASLQANFGVLEDAVDKFRGYGLRCQFYYQSYGQLPKCWPKDQGTTLLSNTAKIFAGTADMQTASLISSMLGKYTQLVESGGDNIGGGSNRGWSQGAQSSSSSTGINRSWQTSSNWQQAPRELLKPEEILTLPPRWAITFPGGGVPPVLTHLVRYFEEPALFQRRAGGLISRFRAACRTLIGSILLLAVAIGLAVALTQEINRQAGRIMPWLDPAPLQPPAQWPNPGDYPWQFQPLAPG
jgi:type IV secretion system protein VirD4